MNMSKYIPSYLATLFVTVVAVAAFVFGINFAVDPMWYWGGNKIGSINYAFNERLSKVNRFLATKDDYNCLIFGDSRVTLLPEREIEKYRCFNFAFSAGKAEEAVAYARYIRAAGFEPDLVIVGVAATAFREHIGMANIPDFIRKMGKPASPYYTYLSLDAGSMSSRTLFGSSPLDRVYDLDFGCHVAPGAPAYDPRKPIRDLMIGKFNALHRVSFYDDMRGIFPDAELVGYVPPISAWAMRAYAEAGWLEDYVTVLHLASTKFDRFIDYGIPSDLTVDTSNTYDGTHYSEAANSAIADTLLSGGSEDSLDVKKISRADMLDLYHQRLERYRPVILSELQD